MRTQTVSQRHGGVKWIKSISVCVCGAFSFGQILSDPGYTGVHTSSLADNESISSPRWMFTKHTNTHTVSPIHNFHFCFITWKCGGGKLTADLAPFSHSKIISSVTHVHTHTHTHSTNADTHQANVSHYCSHYTVACPSRPTSLSPCILSWWR